MGACCTHRRPGGVHSDHSSSQGSMSDKHSKNNIITTGSGKKFEVGKVMGIGSFGEVHLGKNLATKEEVAIKLERKDAERPSLPLEWNFYKSIGTNQIGFPRIHDFAPHNEFNALIMDKLGKNIETKFEESNMNFPLKTILMIGIQMIERIQLLHSRKIVFRDVKPDNFLLGINPGTENILHIIDFGLAKYYMDENGKHIPQQKKPMLTGTVRYISIHAHKMEESSRRDDIESIAYVLCYFLLNGNLPWQNLPQNLAPMEKYNKVAAIKEQTTPQALAADCAQRNPSLGNFTWMANFLKHARGLKFAEQPNYDYLKHLLLGCMKDHKIHNDNHFDWPSGSGPKSRIVGPTATNRPIHGSNIASAQHPH